MSKRKSSELSAALTKKVKKLPSSWADVRNGDDTSCIEGPKATILEEVGKPPKRSNHGTLAFEGYPKFRPNKTPREVIEAGAFGGGYFRKIKSSVEKDTSKLKNQHLEFPFFSDIPNNKLTNSQYDASINKYKVSCGGSLQMWQSKGWISQIDPYGWFQWYCRFYSGRRSSDDERQIDRWAKCTGEKGRWKNNLITKIINAGASFDDASVSPVVRQTLLHWGYALTERDFKKAAKARLK